MSSRENQRQKIVDIAQKKGIQIVELKNGSFWLTGHGIDIKTTDLAFVTPDELNPCQRRSWR